MTLGGSNSDSVAQDQIKAFVERIMRMREEAKAINDDIREIYAEAKANGFDKTVLGKIVLHVERRSKDSDKVLEAQALFDLYLDAFDGATGTVNALTHTHEADVAQRIEQRPPKPQAAGSIPAVSTNSEPAHNAAATGDSDAGAAAVSGSNIGGRALIDAGEGEASLSPVHLSPPTAADNARALRPHCLHADDLSKCAGQGRKHCWACQKAHADAERLSA